jgi:two-component system cell cycle response regulator
VNEQLQEYLETPQAAPGKYPLSRAARDKDVIRTLVADDDPVTRRTLQKLLTKRGYEVVVAANGIEASELLQREDAPRLALLDWLMPGMTGIDVCRRVRSSQHAAYTYVIMLTAQDEKKHFQTGMKAGADDYISKPFDITEVDLRLRAGERIITLQEQLRVEAHEDALTKTLNRGAIVKLLGRELARATRAAAPLSVLMVDIDHFKSVNDTYGHQVGDTALRGVADSLALPLRAYDGLGRFGGEEFLIVLPGCSRTDAIKVAERVRASVARNPIPTAGGPIATTVSVGVAVEEGQGSGADALIAAADLALYGAKRRGRNRVELSPR